MSFYKAIVAAGLKHASYYSDLYVQDSPALRDLMAQYNKTGEPFINRVEGGRWIDFALCYEPYWESVQRKAQTPGGTE